MSIFVSQFSHSKQDYEKLVAQLLKDHSRDEAMALAVGGDYEQAGKIQEALLEFVGLRRDGVLVDIGCGSGRLANRLSKNFTGKFYGTDVVRALLEYADERTSDNFKFFEVDRPAIPVPDSIADMVTAFSVFTHTLHEETYLYFEEAARVLKPSGQLVFSFLEFLSPQHKEVFRQSMEAYRSGQLKHLNMFLDRAGIEAMAKMVGLGVKKFINGWDRVIPIPEPIKYWNGYVEDGTCSFGQSIAILTKATTRPI